MYDAMHIVFDILFIFIWARSDLEFKFEFFFAV